MSTNVFSITQKPSVLPKSPEEDDIISMCIGDYGRWQFRQTFIITLFTTAFCFGIFSPTFTSAEREFWCARPFELANVPIQKWKNYSQTPDGCKILNLNWSTIDISQITNGENREYSEAEYTACTSWEWDTSSITSTIISQWELVCGRSHLATIVEVSLLVGVGFGAIITGLIADRFGRKSTLIISVACQILVGIIMIFHIPIELLILLKFITGFTLIALYNTGFILALEIVGGRWRTIVGICNFFWLPLSYIAIAGISMLLPDWKHLQLTLMLINVPLIFTWWIIPESPVWLLDMEKVEELKVLLKTAAKENRFDLPDNFESILTPKEKLKVKSEVLDLFRDKMYITTLNSCFAWFACTATYYGLALKLGSLGGDLYVTTLVSSLVELPAIAISVPIILKCGRRYPSALFMLIAGICYLASVFFEDERYFQVKITIIMIGKFAAGFINAVITLLTAELFPTLIRNLGMGSNQLLAGMSLICVPYIWQTAMYYSQLPMGIIGVLTIIGSVSIFFLTHPEEKATIEKLKGISNTHTESDNSTFKGNADMFVTRF